MSRQRFLYCHQDGSRQESGVATDLALGRDFMSQVFFCHDRGLVKTKAFLVMINYLYITIDFSKVERFYVAT